MQYLIVLACVLAAASAGHLVAPVAAVYSAPQHLPVIGANGVPVDTPEVQHARAAHLAHKYEAHARNGDYAVVAHAPVVAAAYAAPAVAYGYAPSAHAYATSGVHPSSVHGVPLETPEVVAAKSHHFAAHAEALARNGHLSAVHLARRRRGIVAAPLAYSAYTAPLAYSTPYGYSSHYVAAHSPVVSSYAHPYAYAAPYAHYY